MAYIKTSIADDLLSIVKTRATEKGYSTLSSYLKSLVYNDCNIETDKKKHISFRPYRDLDEKINLSGFSKFINELCIESLEFDRLEFNLIERRSIIEDLSGENFSLEYGNKTTLYLKSNIASQIALFAAENGITKNSALNYIIYKLVK